MIVLDGEGKLVETSSKLRLMPPGEPIVFEAGTERPIFRWNSAKVAIVICREILDRTELAEELSGNLGYPPPKRTLQMAANRTLMTRIRNPGVAAVFDAYPPKFRRKLLALRRLILETARSTEGVGEIEETLKWGEPAYLTSQTKSGTTIRIHWKESAPYEYAIYFHCQTDLIATFRDWFPREFRFDGNRRIVFDEDEALPVEPLSACIAAALTYHRDKRLARRSG